MPLLKPCGWLAGRDIVLLTADFGSLLAVQRQPRKPLAEWACAEVQEWARANGLEDYERILRSEGVDGRRLKEMGKAELH